MVTDHLNKTWMAIVPITGMVINHDDIGDDGAPDVYDNDNDDDDDEG
jgi:hypothetical protein